MNPVDALQQDWHLYYDGSWMRHQQLGPGQVVVSGTELYFYSYPNDVPEAAPRRCMAGELSYWWPNGGAINTPFGACFVTRTATRSMRKSAHAEHYGVSWHGPNFPMDKTQLMLWLRRGPALIDVDFAMKAMDNQMTPSVAVAKDMIFAATPQKGMYDVVYRGVVIGKIKGRVFMPYYEDAPITRRCALRMREEGIL